VEVNVRARLKRWPVIRVAVAEQSMVPALHPGDWLLAWRTRRVRPGQVVLAWHPQRPGFLLVKRVAWWEKGRGDTGGGWWLASDNPIAGAVDSARFGPVPSDLIVARVLVRYWPVRRGRGTLKSSPGTDRALNASGAPPFFRGGARRSLTGSRRSGAK
jgi:nickel-type superoxide dismutase maturation protease